MNQVRDIVITASWGLVFSSHKMMWSQDWVPEAFSITMLS